MTEDRSEIEPATGPPPRHIDLTTERLSAYAKAFEDAQSVRKAAHLRGDELAAEMFSDTEKQLSRRLGKTLKGHVLWPWLEGLSGLAGPLSARVIAIIGDPRRFPGQQCSIGHTLPPVYRVGEPCPVVAEVDRESEANTGDDVSDRADPCSESDSYVGAVDVSPDTDRGYESDVGSGVAGVSGAAVAVEFDGSDGSGSSRATDEVADESDHHDVRCAGTMLAPRPGTGVRSLWHYAGLHVIDGALPKRRKGTQADWNPTLRTLALQPNGIADQIIKHRCEPYRTTYDEARERGKFHKVARTIAAKQFLGDLLVEWKQLVGEAEVIRESEETTGLPDTERKAS